VHTRTSYRVGYYTLYTGDVEPVTLKRPDDAAPLITVLKLVRPSEVCTCIDCYREPAIRGNRDILFRPELTGNDEESA